MVLLKKNNTMKNIIWIKISLIIILLLCLLDMPYWYFQLVRIFGTIGFGYLAYLDYKNKLKLTPYIFGIAAILLNPIVKISFGRNVWNVIDIILALILLLTIVFGKKQIFSSRNC